MFQPTNQLTVCYGKWMVKWSIFWCTYETWWCVQSSNYQRVNDMILYQSIWCLYGVIWYGLGCKMMQDFTDFQELWGKNNPKWLILEMSRSQIPGSPHLVHVASSRLLCFRRQQLECLSFKRAATSTAVWQKGFSDMSIGATCLN
jgi:hypothetical protein